MNKRIKKKIMKRALNKYKLNLPLTNKEYHLIKHYIFLQEFDFPALYSKVSEIAGIMIDKFSRGLNAFFKEINKDSLGIEEDDGVAIKTYYGGTNPND